VRSTDHKAPHCVIFSTPLLGPLTSLLGPDLFLSTPVEHTEPVL